MLHMLHLFQEIWLLLNNIYIVVDLKLMLTLWWPCFLRVIYCLHHNMLTTAMLHMSVIVEYMWHYTSLYKPVNPLTHWGRVTHTCVSELTIIGSDNSLSPDRRQAIIWTSAGILLIGPSGTNFNEILIKILTFSFKKMRLKVSSAKRRPFCLGLNVLMKSGLIVPMGFFTRDYS